MGSIDHPPFTLDPDIEQCIDMFLFGNKYARSLAAIALACFDTRDATLALINALEAEKDPKVRQDILHGLEKHRNQDAAIPLELTMRKLEEDECKVVRETAQRILSRQLHIN